MEMNVKLRKLLLATALLPVLAASAACHVARTVTRRAERRVWALARAEHVAPEVPQYLNRLSDLLFVLRALSGLYWTLRALQARVPVTAVLARHGVLLGVRPRVDADGPDEKPT